MVLTVDALTYRRAVGAQPLLDNVSFALSRGEVICLLGLNGAGKTTLLRCLIGALVPERGQIKIAARERTAYTARELARLVAYVPQATHDSTLSLLDIVLMGRTPHMPFMSLPKAHDESVARNALASVGIAHLEARPFNRVSGGERQLALIARALAQQPAIMLLDEPAASLDIGNQALLLRIIRQLAGQQLTILMTTHQPEHALLLNSRAAVLDKGRIVAEGQARDVVRADLLSDLYGTRIHILDHEGFPAACIPQL